MDIVATPLIRGHANTPYQDGGCIDACGEAQGTVCVYMSVIVLLEEDREGEPVHDSFSKPEQTTQKVSQTISLQLIYYTAELHSIQSLMTARISAPLQSSVAHLTQVK